MKIPNVKAMLAKAMAAGVLTGALMVAGAPQAQAQAFAVGVQFGGPHVGYVEPGFYARQRWEREEFARQQAFAREQAYARERAFDRERAYGWYGGRRFGAPRGGYYGR